MDTPRFKISADGRDALLKFGVNRGKTLSKLVKSDPSYLEFILREDFDEELKDVCRYLLKANRNA